MLSNSEGLMSATAAVHPASIPEVTHHHAVLGGSDLHYVSAGTGGSPVLLVHGFPETWWAFHELIPRLAHAHRVFAVDLPGFGDSAHAPGDYTSAAAAAALIALIESLELGPVHLSGQDISGTTAFRVAATRPDLVRSFAAIETGLPGFGLEVLGDIYRGGAWHLGVLATPGIAEMLLTGRERAFLADYAFPAMCATPGAITASDLAEFLRTYERPDGFRGAAGLYRSTLTEAPEIRALAAERPLAMPVLAVGAGTGEFTAQTMRQVASDVATATIPDVGHLAAIEAPAALAEALLGFYRAVEA